MSLSEPGALVLKGCEAGVATLTLNRPARLNALTRAMLIELRSRLEDCAADSSIRCVLLNGSGKGFCAGQDLSERDPRGRTETFDLEAIQIELFHPVIRAMREMRKPVIAAVNGIAAGAGSSLALAADIVIAARSAKFIQSFVKVGLSVDAGGGWALAKALGERRARALLMTGEPLDAESAERMGLIWRCVDDDALQAKALTLAAALAAGPPLALASIKQAVAAAVAEPNLDCYLVQEARLQGAAGASKDYSEGVLAFLEKRPPVFGV